MKIGFVGLGKMGGNMVQRLLAGGHEVTVYDRSPEAVAAAGKHGASSVSSLPEMAQTLPAPRAVWLMVPAGAPVDDCIAELRPHLERDDIIIDGGNSNWRQTQQRSAALAEAGIHFVDCGTSGGVWGLANGYCLMVGGDADACALLEPVFHTLAPPRGHLYVGPSGAGHFTKMIHNGIEYGMMQAYAEGFEIMQNSPFDIDLRAVSEVWQHGSVVRSWLLELLERALAADPKLAGLKDYVQDSGEGRWTVQAAIDFDTPAPVTTAALFARFQSRQEESFAMKVLAALRQQFGGHSVQTK